MMCVMVEADSHLKLLPTSILDILSVWAHWYDIHMHIVAALHSYTHTNWLRLWDTWSLVEPKWCDYVMFEADSHLKLLPTSKWCHFIMFEADSHLKLSSRIHVRHLNWYGVYRHTVAALHSYTHPNCLRFWGYGSLVVKSKKCDHVMLRLTATSNFFPAFILDTYKVVEHINILVIGIE